jgi:hypothetical protein
MQLIKQQIILQEIGYLVWTLCNMCMYLTVAMSAVAKQEYPAATMTPATAISISD